MFKIEGLARERNCPDMTTLNTLFDVQGGQEGQGGQREALFNNREFFPFSLVLRDGNENFFISLMFRDKN